MQVLFSDFIICGRNLSKLFSTKTITQKREVLVYQNNKTLSRRRLKEKLQLDKLEIRSSSNNN